MKDIESLDKDYIQNLYIKIGKNVKRIREEKEISQLTLAQAIGHKSVTVISCCEICYKNYHFNIFPDFDYIKFEKSSVQLNILILQELHLRSKKRIPLLSNFSEIIREMNIHLVLQKFK